MENFFIMLCVCFCLPKKLTNRIEKNKRWKNGRGRNRRKSKRCFFILFIFYFVAEEVAESTTSIHFQFLYATRIPQIYSVKETMVEHAKHKNSK